MHLEKIKRAPIGKKTQERKGLGFVQEKSVVLAGEQIDRENEDKIHLRPRERADNSDRSRPESVNQHQKNDADYDAGMGDKETDEAQIGKSKLQIRRDDRLKRSTDSPKICDFEPSTIPRPKRNDDDEHRPITELQRQHPRPGRGAKLASDDQIRRVIDY